MKTLFSILTGILLIVQLASGESVVFGWYAVQESDPRYGLTVNMTGPSEMNKVPDKNGVFKGQYQWHKDWEPKLQRVFKVSVDSDGVLVSQPVQFTTNASAQVVGKDMHKTTFETAAIRFDDGDAFLLTFQIGDQTVLVLLKIMRKTIAM